MKYTNIYPKEVLAYEVIEAELFELASWCNGEVEVDDGGNEYIAVQDLKAYPGRMLVNVDGHFEIMAEDHFAIVYVRASDD